MVKPLVSFIIPVLNGEQFIGRCLTSIRLEGSPHDEYEVLVVDNGSTDKTLQIIQSLGFTYEVVPRLNVSALRNYAASSAKGRYLAFVDSDVELLPGWIENGLVSFQDESVVAAGCFPSIPSDATWVQKTWDLHQRGRQSSVTMKSIAWLPSMNLIVRREDFMAVQGFNENLQTAEDVDLCYRLGDRGKIICNLAMNAIHWGEAPDLQVFWRKEVWRGLGNLHGILSHGLRWDEIPSVGYPIYFFIFVLSLCVGAVVDTLARQFFFTPIFLLCLMLPPLILAGYTVWIAKRPMFVPQLFILYFEYGLARAYALAKSLNPWGK